MKFLRAIIFSGGLLLLFACSSPSSQKAESISAPLAQNDSLVQRKEPRFMMKRESSTAGTIIIAVDENLMPIIETEIATFEGLYPEAHIRAEYLPGELAIERMLNSDSVRLAISTRRLSAEEEAYLEGIYVNPRYATVAKTAVAVVIHPDNSAKKMSQEQILGILTGKLQRWDQIDPNSSLGEINLVFDHPNSSTIRFLTDSILGGESFPKERVFAQQSTPEVLRYVATNPNSIGFGGWNWISDVDDPETAELRSGVRLVWLERDKGEEACFSEEEFVGPYQGYLVQDCYLFTRHMTTIMRESISGLGTGFVAHLDGPQGQRIIHKAGLGTMRGISRKIRLPAREDAQKIRRK